MRYVLEREKIIETSYMLNLSSAEEGLHTALLTQFSFICFFAADFPYSGLVNFVLHVPIMLITIKMYSYVSRRTISKRSVGLGIWKNFYDTISYLGIIFNAYVLARGTQRGRLVNVLRRLGANNEDLDFYVYNIQNILLILKFMLSILVPKMPVWVYNRVIREDQRRARNDQKKSKMFGKLIDEAKVDSGAIDLSEDSDLKHFFDNQNTVKGFVNANLDEDGKSKNRSEPIHVKVNKDQMSFSGATV